MALKASVVLCTFQGERYLQEQLASLRVQTVAPAEVLVQDDGSDDGTLSLLEREAKAHPSFPLKILQNEKRLGFAQNFATAISRASGDVIFPCDQDDIWDPRKLEALLDVFRDDPDLPVAICDAVLVDSSNRDLAPSVLEKNGLGPFELDKWGAGRAFPRLLRSNPVPGNCVAIRRTYLKAMLPVPESWEHDYWSLIVAAGLGSRIGCCREPLVRYRQHASQVIGGGDGLGQRFLRASRKTVSGYAAEASRIGELLDRLQQQGAPASNIELASQKMTWLLARSRFPESRTRRLFPIAASLAMGRYHQFEAGLSSAIKDWLAPY